jgi:peptidoglycan/LPS O-acetylase OafA/YrhL
MTASPRERQPLTSGARLTGRHESLRDQQYYPWVDVLRGIAFLMVFFNHFGNRFNLWNYSFLSRGGVSLFFVISGWLITLIILKTRDRPDFLTYFYSRRALRIFPAYFVTIVAYALYARLFGKHSFFHALPAFLTFNFSLLPYSSELFDHAWSLAVEERFYLIWPSVCVVCRYLRVPLIPVLAVLVLFCAGSLFPIPQLADPAWAPLLPASILYGCLLALIGSGSKLQPPAGRWRLLLGGLSFGAFLYVGNALGSMYHPVACLFTAIVVWCAGVRSDVFPRYLRAVARVGEMSYGMYLIHLFPLYGLRAVLYSRLPRIRGVLWLPIFLLALGMTIALAAAMRRFIENPVTDLRNRLSNRPRTARVLAVLQISLIPAGILFWLVTRAAR